MLPKLERNSQLVELRDRDPKKYSFGKLASMFNIDKSWVFRIYIREKQKALREIGDSNEGVDN